MIRPHGVPGKAIYVVGVAALIAAIALPLVSNALSIPGIRNLSTMLQTTAIATDWDQKGYLGSTTHITIAVSYGGVTARVSVTTKSDAHIALAAAIFATYDTVIHKFRSFGGSLGTDLKNGCTFANWECYAFELVGKSTHLSKNIGWDHWLYVEYQATVTVKVKHWPYWFAQPEIKYVKLTANPVAVIPPGAYSKTMPVVVDH